MSEANKYDRSYKEQSVKLALEIGVKRASEELKVPYGTLYVWVQAAKNGDLDIEERTPENAMSLAEEIRQLRSEVKRLNKENKRLQEERDFLNEAAAFFAHAFCGLLQVQLGQHGHDEYKVAFSRALCDQCFKHAGGVLPHFCRN